MRVRVTHGIGDLARDTARVPVKAAKGMAATVRRGAQVGNSEAKDLARKTAGRHGKLYHRAFTHEMVSAVVGGTFAAEYGPESTRPQGGMSFERGSRNQPPHNDLAKSADLMGPALAGEVRRLPDQWFW